MATLVDVEAVDPGACRRLDDESRQWVEALTSSGQERELAIARLHKLLVGAAWVELQRQRPGLPHLRGNDFDDLAVQSADDAVVALLGRLDEFRGDSRFTTWVYKFAVFTTSVTLRRRAWQGRELPLPDGAWEAFVAAGKSPQAEVETAELLLVLGEGIDSRLTRRQRDVFLAVTLNDVPIDVLADHLTTTRGALYKTVHDARRKLRTHLSEAGMALDERAAPKDRAAPRRITNKGLAFSSGTLQ